MKGTDNKTYDNETLELQKKIKTKSTKIDDKKYGVIFAVFMAGLVAITVYILLQPLDDLVEISNMEFFKAIVSCGGGLKMFFMTMAEAMALGLLTVIMLITMPVTSLLLFYGIFLLGPVLFVALLMMAQPVLKKDPTMIVILSVIFGVIAIITTFFVVRALRRRETTRMYFTYIRRTIGSTVSVLAAVSIVNMFACAITNLFFIMFYLRLYFTRIDNVQQTLCFIYVLFMNYWVDRTISYITHTAFARFYGKKYLEVDTGDGDSLFSVYASVLRFNLCTILFAAFMIAILRTLRFLVDACLDTDGKNTGQGGVAQVIMFVVGSILWWILLILEAAVAITNIWGLTLVGIEGNGYSKSAKRAKELAASWEISRISCITSTAIGFFCAFFSIICVVPALMCVCFWIYIMKTGGPSSRIDPMVYTIDIVALFNSCWILVETLGIYSSVLLAADCCVAIAPLQLKNISPEFYTRMRTKTSTKSDNPC